MGKSNRFISFTIKQGKSAKVCSTCIKELVCALVLFTVFPVQAELVVLGKIGNTVSAKEYYKNLNTKDVKLDYNRATKLLDSAKKSISENVFFPLLTKKMRPGLLSGHRFDSSKRIQPIAVIGTDPISLKWLKLRRDKLIELKAPIYVVEAESFEVVRKLAGTYKRLKFVPANGDGLAEDLKVKAYPFLVTSAGVWQ